MPDEPGVPRVIASYSGVPCEKLRPDDALTRPGEVCGEIHLWCRGHVRSKDSPRYGDPCSSPALLGICTCRPHGGQLPESRAMNQRARAERAVGQLVGDGTPVEDPIRAFAQLLGQQKAWRDATRELVDLVQKGDRNPLIDGDGEASLPIEAGGQWFRYDKDGEVVGAGIHPEVTGNVIVQNPSGAYTIHPLVKLAEDAEMRYVRTLEIAARLGIEERLVRLEEAQIDQAIAAGRLFVERVLAMIPGASEVLDQDAAMGLFFQAARDLGAIETTVSESIQAHVVRTLDDPIRTIDEPEADPGTNSAGNSDRPVWP